MKYEINNLNNIYIQKQYWTETVNTTLIICNFDPFIAKLSYLKFYPLQDNSY